MEFRVLLIGGQVCIHNTICANSKYRNTWLAGWVDSTYSVDIHSQCKLAGSRIQLIVPIFSALHVVWFPDMEVLTGEHTNYLIDRINKDGGIP
jgi:hypothetical protein